MYRIPYSIIPKGKEDKNIESISTERQKARKKKYQRQTEAHLKTVLLKIQYSHLV